MSKSLFLLHPNFWFIFTWRRALLSLVTCNFVFRHFPRRWIEGYMAEFFPICIWLEAILLLMMSKKKRGSSFWLFWRELLSENCTNREQTRFKKKLDCWDWFMFCWSSLSQFSWYERTWWGFSFPWLPSTILNFKLRLSLHILIIFFGQFQTPFFSPLLRISIAVPFPNDIVLNNQQIHFYSWLRTASFHIKHSLISNKYKIIIALLF